MTGFALHATVPLAELALSAVGVEPTTTERTQNPAARCGAPARPWRPIAAVNVQCARTASLRHHAGQVRAATVARTECSGHARQVRIFEPRAQAVPVGIDRDQRVVAMGAGVDLSRRSAATTHHANSWPAARRPRGYKD